ncbi:hypothetical protein [Mesobacillus zeae]|uniref:Uncharacterized protein n=1 Tax=Mesobacillus zeae TaxID=1917180 RepID=A0A398BES6_9BACI|nr:hypothetical protein [Mesobacillus zeae]RID88104.1 hypothetical protein D1970_04545 [Mesobacillus zeae]
MFRIEFIDQNTNVIFREKTFGTAMEMHLFIKNFELKEGKKFTFFNSQLQRINATFFSLASFSGKTGRGFRLYFDISEDTKENMSMEDCI